MPEISRYQGVIFYIHPEPLGNQKHNLPHIHAWYQGQVVILDLEGNILEGRLPKKKLRLAQKWVMMNKEYCLLQWNIYCGG